MVTAAECDRQASVDHGDRPGVDGNLFLAKATAAHGGAFTNAAGFRSNFLMNRFIVFGKLDKGQ